MVKLNIVKERLVYLAPAVQANWDDESNIHDFEVLKVLGRGSFGVVRKVRHKKTLRVYALKEIDKKDIKDRRMIEQVRNQLKIMYSLNHPNIIKLYSHFEDDLHISLIIEFAERGQLYQSLMTNPAKRFTEIEVAKIVYQIVEAMKYMHEKGIAHRDIKPENILLDAHGNAKLADFGWSNYFTSQAKRTTYCGTLDYLAPEMIEKEHKHDHTIDLWAIGILIFELCTGTSPFSANIASKTQTDMEKEVKNNILHLNYKTPSYLSNTCKDLLHRLLVINPAERLPTHGIKQHSWIKTHYVPHDIRKPKWAEELKSEFSKIVEGKEESGPQEKCFTPNEIYEFSRPDSIINDKRQPKKQQETEHNSSFHSEQSPLQLKAHKNHLDTKSFNLSNSHMKEFSKTNQDTDRSRTDLQSLLERIKDLEAKSARDDEEIRKLKHQPVMSHTECERTRTELEANFSVLRKKYESQKLKLAASEAKVRELELRLASVQPATLKTEPGAKR